MIYVETVTSISQALLFLQCFISYGLAPLAHFDLGTFYAYWSGN